MYVQLYYTVQIAVRRIFGTRSLKYVLFSTILVILMSSEWCPSCQDFTNLTQCHQQSTWNHRKSGVHSQPNCLRLGLSPLAWTGHRTLSQLEGPQGPRASYPLPSTPHAFSWVLSQKIHLHNTRFELLSKPDFNLSLVSFLFWQ